jgi:hypothetical protein
MSNPYRSVPPQGDDQWTRWLGPQWRDRLPVDETNRELAEPVHEEQKIAALAALAGAQAREVTRLQAIVLTLVRALGDKGTVDLDALRIAATSNMHAAGVDPLRPRGPVTFDPDRLVECVRCEKAVPARTTLVTGDGPVCGDCHAG